MSDRTTLKTYFETGDIPTEAQFIDLIDSLAHLTDDLISQGEAEAGTATTSRIWTAQRVAQAIAAQTSAIIEIGFAGSDEDSDLSAGTGILTFRMPYAMTVTEVRANVKTAPTGSTIIVDINESGTTILSTKLSIDAGEKTSTTAATPPVISDSSLVNDSEITIDLDQVGATIAGTGIKFYLIGTRT